jgi:glycolate oxidase
VTGEWLATVDVEWTADPSVLDSRRLDRSGTEPAGTPAAVVFPRSPEQVQQVLRGAHATRTPVVPRGAGTALTGATTAGAGEIVLDLARMNRILEIRPEDGIAVAEPGVITADLDRAAAAHGLRYAPDPASLQISTIGGNIATNAGGLRCAKYGVTRDSVLGLDVVLADGRRIGTGRATLKGVAGYDLTGLFVGSEGTLGVVVGATLRLRSLPEPTATLAASYPGMAEAAAASVALAGARIQPVLAELLDEATLTAIDAAEGTRLSESGAALLIVQVDGGPEEADRAAEVLGRGASTLRATTDPQQTATLLAARRQALPSIERLGRPLIEDIAVPRSRLPDAVQEIGRIARRHDLPICTMAHAGDGNLHPIIVTEGVTEGATDAVIPPAAEAAADRIFALALELGGTITAEHGVGRLKREWARRELGPDVHGLQLRLRALFDPQGILNPGSSL